MKGDFYQDYYKKNPVYAGIKDLKDSYTSGFTLLKNNISRHINKYSREIKILEIGSGSGYFANYCNILGFKNYIGFELDKNMTQRVQAIFPHYTFYTSDVFEFLKQKGNNFDIIFISHVFEHLEEEKAYELSQLIYERLTPGGIRINTMPNAEAPYISQRYLDITHKKLYCENSFSQILVEVGFKKENITHYEQVLGNNKVVRGILKICKYFHKLFLMSAGIYPPKIFTQNIFTVAKK